MIDLRSDTVTRPTPGMLKAMADAEVGDDVFGEDPTVLRLQARVAELLGMEDALFVPSGTMGNQIGIRLHCRGGDEFLCEQNAHVFQYEQAAFAQLFGICAQIVPTPDGLLTPELLEDRVRPDNDHAPRTRLVCLENTHNRKGGRTLPQAGVERVCEWAQQQGLARHLDGARFWNACVAAGNSPAELVAPFDTVSVCFSKGLGAPVGSAICGPKELIREARRVRKALGGGWRQAGVLAAAALYALDHHYDRLADDHAHAQLLAAAVRESPGLSLVDGSCDTNLVILEVDPVHASGADFHRRLTEAGVGCFQIGKQRIRLVTHLDLTAEQVAEAAEIIGQLAG
ncbi:L-allo-threonine aldolase [Posidoniimonas polymericola]|uniref:L-allo-threonine aldolase n=1 Tax=Posidoniimonas polymericola TaxID=2528002 RepID=A0A5C5YT22_9BACT|nr:GntG family PLP-dependent aldolase [Posidoniimonas polymericola]TWT77951.1 L-allo-threonine aldolase [Posidoniimonas polymericola]